MARVLFPMAIALSVRSVIFTDLVISSRFEGNLAGPLKVHCALKHKIEFAELESRLSAAAR